MMSCLCSGLTPCVTRSGAFFYVYPVCHLLVVIGGFCWHCDYLIGERGERGLVVLLLLVCNVCAVCRSLITLSLDVIGRLCSVILTLLDIFFTRVDSR